MENHKSFFWSQGLLIALVGLVGSFSLGLMMLVKPNTSEAQSQQSINEITTSAKAGTQARIESLKAMMLTSWQQQAQAKGFAYALPASFLGATIDAAKLSPEKKVIALTFDDGPWPESTAQVLNILKKNDIKATFFVVGQNVKNYPDLTKQVVAEGHTIANHTWHHWYHHMNPQVAAYEIENTTDIIFKTTGVKTNLFRPPGGNMHNGVAAYARNSKYAIIMWSSDSIDYSRPGVQRLVKNVFRQAQPGGIVLMHDGGGNRSQTVEALPTIIENFRKEGYSFVTVPELLEMQDKEQKVLANKK
ncbi:polysaccharide deacetylase [Calothrix sp. NIES-2100]|uniref:polysaccharide deacetylase family protein n=1 Tax=Calothrix sp. NIES-2100 TaxID=1954172 RepID=UPI000B612F68|nr:polysaccharide deacetylase [Calothrix sp. NIES-2100]